MREWADPVEKKQITRLSNIANDKVSFMLGIVRAEFNGAALEVACGEGLLSRDLLVKFYKEVHLFDRDTRCLR